MCFFADNSAAKAAEAARQQEEARQGRIASGRTAINEAFAGFDDPYYSGIEKDALAFYNDDLERQYEQAKKSLVFNLGRSGNLNASAGAQRLGRLNEALARNQTITSNNARTQAQNARSEVERNRSELVNTLVASSDPSGAGSSALARAELLSQPKSFEPIGDLFSQFGNAAANAVLAQKAGHPGWGLPDSFINPVGRGSSPSRVVN